MVGRRRWVTCVGALVLACVLPASALAQHHGAAAAPADDHVYVVRSGDTLSSVAEHLGVEPMALAARNYLTRPFSLRIGRRLRVPAGVAADVLRRLPTRSALDARSGGGGDAGGAHVVTLVRARDQGVLETNLRAATPALRVRMERFLRYRDGSRHIVHPRLIHVLADIGDHFEGHRIVVLSGFRPVLRNRSAPRSRHSQGYAVDLRVEGVSLAALQTYCSSLENLGCGLYARGRYVHVDVRRESDDWMGGRTVSPRDAATDPDHAERIEDVLTDAAPMRADVADAP